MKKNLLFVLFGAAVLLTMNACKSDDENVLSLDKELKLSTLTVEQQKARIEENGQKLITAMEDMQETKAMATLMSMVEIDGSEAYAAPMQKLVLDIRNKRANAVRNFDQQMRAKYVDSDVWGVYDYNFKTNQMEKKSNLTNAIVFNFPASDASTTNNAKITINYTPSTVEVPGLDAEMYPSAISLVMTVDSKEVMTANFSGKYDANNLPQDVQYTMTMDTYKWNIHLTQNKSIVTELVEFKKGTEVLVKIETKVDGNFDPEQLSTSTLESTFKAAVINMQLMDVAILGGTNDLKGFITEMNKNEDESFDDMGELNPEYHENVVKIFNKYLSCKAYFVSENSKFADVELYLAKVEDTYEVFNWETYEYEVVTETNYLPRPRLVLVDGSKVAVDEYFAEGFEQLIENLEQMGQDLDSKLN